MSDQVQTFTDASNLAIAKNARAAADGKPPVKPLADQIHFSSILRHLIDPPEKTLEAAQKPVDPVEARLARRAEEKKQLRDSSPQKQDEDRISHTKGQTSAHHKADAIETAARPADTGKGDTQPPPASNDQPQPKVDENGFKQSVELSGNGGDTSSEDVGSVPAAEAAAPAQPTTDAASILAQTAAPAPAKATQPTQEQAKPVDAAVKAPIDKGAQEQIAGALTDKDFSDLPEDLYRASHRETEPQKQPRTSNSAATALANKQAQDLAQRLGAGTGLEIQVNVANTAAKPHTGPDQGLTSASNLTQLATFTEGETSKTPQPSNNGANGDAAGARNHGVDPQAVLNRTAPQNLSQDQLAFLQMVKAQAAATQPAANAPTLGSKFQPVAADTIQTNAATGPAGPSQVSQTAKANPTTAARQPTPARPPAEQVALQIKKAIGAGADKINIKLQPAELGRVEVKLEIGKDGHIQAHVLADKPETLDMLQRDARGLERALQDAGLRTTSDSLSFGLRNDTHAQSEAGRNGRRGPGGHPSERRDMPEAARDHGILMNPSVYGRNLSTNGGVDIRI